MSAIIAITEARAAGIQLCVEGDDLVMAASAPPLPAVLDLLSRHKTAIVMWLRPCADGWSAEDWQVYFDERAGIAEFDGGLSRPEAEAQAFECCVVEWLNRNLVCSPSDHCLGCGEAEQTNDPLLPFGAHANGHAWLHEGCWSEWCQARKVQAVAVLLSMRITVSPRKPET